MTSIEWLEQNVQLKLKSKMDYTFKELFKEAKLIHKKEIINASEAGFNDGYFGEENMIYQNAEHYYNETFGGKNEQ
jgi:hypothetical protein